jgi:D-3-phosphoglycerate dehydrogenase
MNSCSPSFIAARKTAYRRREAFRFAPLFCSLAHFDSNRRLFAHSRFINMPTDILVSEDFESPVLDQLAKRYSVHRDPALWRDPLALRKKVGEARALMVRNQTQVNRELLEGAHNLLAIGRVGVGLDNIDLEAATARGVVVVAPLGANAVSVAELTIGLILSLARKIAFADRSTRNGGWERKACTGMEIAGKTLAICGMGRVGRLVAARARAFEMNIRIYDPFLKPASTAPTEPNTTLCEQFHDALAGADFVTVHSPLTTETRGMFGRAAFAAMKQGSFFINTARGGVVNEAALIDALQSKHLAGAALDVREVEPPKARGALEAMDQVILTPHIAGFTSEAQNRSLEAVCSDLDLLLSGKAAVNFINRPIPGIRAA